jgi:hypothetical protein
MARRLGGICTEVRADGSPCHAAPLRGADKCFWHSPEHASQAAEARRLGGLRRRREATVSTAYEFDGLESIEDIRRLLEIAVLDSLGLENSVARSRVLIAGVQAAAKLLEVGELEKRIDALEAFTHSSKGAA